MKPSIAEIALLFVVTLASSSNIQAFVPSPVLKLPTSSTSAKVNTSGSSISFHLTSSHNADTSTTLFAKKILISFDGTGNNPENFVPDETSNLSFTNVLRLHLLAGGALDDETNEKINDTRTDGQICLYQRGIGGEKDDGKVKSNIKFVLGNLKLETEPMREQLEKVYERGDKLYMIGFSRGSSAARNFAVDLHEHGLTTKDGEKVDNPPIEFLGCFETVSMQVRENFFKILFNDIFKRYTKSKVLGEDGKIARNVKKAVHNVALDDNRQFKLEGFPPVLMGAEERVHEAWFSGEHGDGGGSHYRKGLSDYSCVYMKEWIESLDNGDSIKFIEAEDIDKKCLKIFKEGQPEITVSATDLKLEPDPNDETNLNDDQINKPSYRLVHVLRDDKIVPEATLNIHESVLRRIEATKNPINPNLKKVWERVAVVGSLGKKLDHETKTLQYLLQFDD